VEPRRAVYATRDDTGATLDARGELCALYPQIVAALRGDIQQRGGAASHMGELRRDEH
jgi:hypothetical protein